MSGCKKKHDKHSKDHRHGDLQRSEWFIDSICGSDDHSGKSHKDALRTFAEWQRRVGRKTILDPKGGILTIHILNDLPQSDPVTFDNTIAGGALVNIVGQKKIVASGFLTGVINKDRTVNQPNTLIVAEDPNFWFDKLGLFVFFPTLDNSNTIVARDLGGAQAHVGSWSNGIEFDGVTSPADPPSVGEPYEITDFTSIFHSGSTVNNFGALAGLVFKNLRFKRFEGAFPIGFETVNMPVNIGNADVFGAFSQCIVEPQIFSSFSHNNVLGNCSLLSVTSILRAAQLVTTQCVWNPTILQNEDYPGGIFDEGRWIGADDPTFIGNGVNIFADVHVLGNASIGASSFWGCLHSYVSRFGGNFNLEAFDPLFGESGHVPLWGTGNGDSAISLFQGGAMLIDQIGFGGVFPPGPTIEFASLTDWEFTPVISPTQGHCWDIATATFGPLTANTWANLDIDCTAGGFRVGTEILPFGSQFYSVSTTPQNNALLAKNVLVIN